MYQYFPHKHALVHAVIERYLGEVAAAVEQACEASLGRPVTEASDALVSAYLLAKTRDVDASRALYAASSDLEVTGLVQTAFGRIQAARVRLLASIPDACQPARDLDPGSASNIDPAERMSGAGMRTMSGMGV